MPYVQTVYVNKAELTDEEVWLRAYLSTSDNAVYRTIIADSCLKEFKQRFRQNERT